MTHHNRIRPLLTAAILILAAVIAAAPPSVKKAHNTPMQNAVHLTQMDGTKDSDSTLFPELCSASIHTISVRTPERSFQFHLDDRGTVSVNGTQADSEIFSTLLDQIATLPVDHAAAFPAKHTQLLLTLEISTDTRQHTAHFYEGSESGLVTHIICGAPDAPEYRLTDGWRVGTLVMTCEGTRILDAHGNETLLPLSI